MGGAQRAGRSAEGPLWVVLGDSAAQGLGASSHLTGYVGVVRNRLQARDGRPWRVVNLSRSGARTREVVDVQWPVAAELEADLLTAVVAGNDALRTKEATWAQDVEALCAALPPGAVVATVARGVFERKTARQPAAARPRCRAGSAGGGPVGAHGTALPGPLRRRLPPRTTRATCSGRTRWRSRCVAEEARCCSAVRSAPSGENLISRVPERRGELACVAEVPDLLQDSGAFRSRRPRGQFP